MVNIYIPVCGLCLSFLLIIIYFSKQKLNTIETKLFSYQIISNFVNSILTVIIIYFGYKAPYNIKLFEVLNKLDFWTYILWSSSFFLYIFHISFYDKKIYNKFDGIKKTVFIFDIVVYLLTLILPVYIYNNGYMYSYGPAVSLLYIVVAIYIVFIVFITLFNYKSLKNKKYIPLYSLILIALITMVIRQVNPGLLLISSVIAYVNLIMFFTIENPDMKLLEELHRSKEISDAANEEKTMFLYNISQEIRNSTDMVDDYANLILESNDSEEIKDSARVIKGETSKFNSLMNELFDVSKLDASNIKVYNNKYNVKNVFKGIVAMYTSKCNSKKLEFRVNIDHDIPEMLYGDSINLKKVLMIILDNSLEYTHDGYVEFNVNTIIKNDVCRLIISIDDSGKGIKGEDISKLRLNNKSFSEANKLITLMSGAINISSNYGYGTKVKIILDQKIELIKNKDVVKYEELHDSMKLLMVDDSEAGIKIVEKITKGTNIKLDFAMNGKDFISKIKGEHYDLILLDEQLTQISAIELIKKIRNIKNFDTPIILLTKDNSYEYSEEYKKLGFSDYILKPVKKKDLLDKVNNICKNKNNI